MTTEVLQMVLTAGVQGTTGQGRMFYVKTAAAALTITCDIKGTGATIRKFINIGAGFKFVAPEAAGWTYLRILSATSQNIEIIVGDDDVEVANAVSVTGSVTTQDAPSAALTDTPVKLTVAATTAQLVPQNLARKRVTIFSRPDNVGDSFVFLRSAGGANDIGFIAPGEFIEFRTTARIDYRAVAGGDTLLIFEET